MKLGIVVDDIAGDAGGAFRFQREILDALRSSSANHEIAIFYSNGRLYDVEMASPSQVSSWPSSAVGRMAGRVARSAFARFGRRKYPTPRPASEMLLRAATDEGVDLLWFLTPGVAGFSGIPMVVTVWDLAHRKFPFFPEVTTSGWTWESREAHFRYCLPRASYVITGTEVGKKEITRCYGVDPDRIKVIPFAAPQFNQALRPSGRSPVAEPYLLYPAQFWPHKNHIAVLKALSVLNNERESKLSVVFTGSDKGNLRYVTEVVRELCLEAHVHVLGFVPDHELAHLYQNAVALVFPSFFGPDNLPPLEAFALGCPVIANNAPGSLEQLGDAALLVDCTDINAFAQAILHVEGNSEMRARMINKGKARANGWTARDYARRIIDTAYEFNQFRGCWSPERPFVHL